MSFRVSAEPTLLSPSHSIFPLKVFGWIKSKVTHDFSFPLGVTNPDVTLDEPAGCFVRLSCGVRGSLIPRVPYQRISLTLPLSKTGRGRTKAA